MTQKSKPPGASPRRITMERTFNASLADVWDLWTTAEGLESWWGPEGFSTKVRKLDLRAGGELVYAMTATDPQTVEFMKKAGMPLTTEGRITYTEIVPQQRLGYIHLTDFIPGVAPYDVSTVVEFRFEAQSVRMVLTFDPMHDEQWTEQAVMGWESQLQKLAKIIQ